ncbi:MAG: cytochrome c oxidase subunit 3 [Saprospiraceae bacterium]|nr:cytochrome c oxidase subunit 3 [Saprospiraceae bacterium]
MASTELIEHDVHHDHHEPPQANWDGGSEPFKASYGKLMMWYFLLSDAFTFAGFLIAYGTLRFSMPSWPVPDFVFESFPGGLHGMPLMFVTVMTFILIISSVTMVRAVQEGHRGNKAGVVNWMLATIIGGAMFLGCQAWEWTTLISGENVSVTRNPFGRHEVAGTYTQDSHGHPYAAGVAPETFKKGSGYLIHAQKDEAGKEIVDKDGKTQFAFREFVTETGQKGQLEFGPVSFGALFFFITGFHGFHVLSGVVFLLIIMLNVMTGLYQNRGNHYEMVEKIGLYWHFVDLVWVFVFLVFYLL